MIDDKRRTRKILFIEMYAAGYIVISSMWDVARAQRCELFGRCPYATTYNTSHLSERAIVGYVSRTYNLNDYGKLSWGYL